MGIENDARTEIEMEALNGTYRFKLTLPLLKELQRECGATLGAIVARVLKGRYTLKTGLAFGNAEEGAYAVEDLHWIPRLSLTGGGGGLVSGEPRKVNALVADQLCRDHYDDLPLTEKWTLCAALIGVLVQGYRPATATGTDPPKKAKPVKTTATSTSPAH